MLTPDQIICLVYEKYRSISSCLPTITKKSSSIRVIAGLVIIFGWVPISFQDQGGDVVFLAQIEFLQGFSGQPVINMDLRQIYLFVQFQKFQIGLKFRHL